MGACISRGRAPAECATLELTGRRCCRRRCSMPLGCAAFQAAEPRPRVFPGAEQRWATVRYGTGQFALGGHRLRFMPTTRARSHREEFFGKVAQGGPLPEGVGMNPRSTCSGAAPHPPLRRFVPLALLLATTASDQSALQSNDQQPPTPVPQPRHHLERGAPRRQRPTGRHGLRRRRA